MGSTSFTLVSGLRVTAETVALEVTDIFDMVVNVEWFVKTLSQTVLKTAAKLEGAIGVVAWRKKSKKSRLTGPSEFCRN